MKRISINMIENWTSRLEELWGFISRSKSMNSWRKLRLKAYRKNNYVHTWKRTKASKCKAKLRRRTRSNIKKIQNSKKKRIQGSKSNQRNWNLLGCMNLKTPTYKYQNNQELSIVTRMVLLEHTLSSSSNKFRSKRFKTDSRNGKREWTNDHPAKKTRK